MPVASSTSSQPASISATPPIELRPKHAHRSRDHRSQAVAGHHRGRPAGVGAETIGRQHRQRVEGERLEVVARSRGVGQAVAAQVHRQDARVIGQPARDGRPRPGRRRESVYQQDGRERRRASPP